MMHDGGGLFFGGGFMWIFWLLILLGVFAIAKYIMGSGSRDGDGQTDSPLAILEKRYARGEIDREEFLEKKRELER